MSVNVNLIKGRTRFSQQWVWMIRDTDLFSKLRHCNEIDNRNVRVREKEKEQEWDRDRENVDKQTEKFDI